MPAPGYAEVQARANRAEQEQPELSLAELVQPARVVGWSLTICATGMAGLALFLSQDRSLLWISAAVLAAVATPALLWKPKE